MHKVKKAPASPANHGLELKHNNGSHAQGTVFVFSMLQWLGLAFLLICCTNNAPIQHPVLHNTAVQQQLQAFMQQYPLDSTALYYLDLKEQHDTLKVVMSSVNSWEEVENLQPCAVVQISSQPVLMITNTCAQHEPVDIKQLRQEHTLVRSNILVSRRIRPNGDTVTWQDVTFYCPPELLLKVYQNRIVELK